MRESKLRSPVILATLMTLLLIACQLSHSRDTVDPNRESLAPGDTIRTLIHADRERTYIVHVPPGHDSTQPAPVVLLFHGGLGNAENMQRMTGFDAVADANDVIAVYPNGTGRFEDKLLTWNGGQCCGYAVEQRIDDVGFVKALIEDLAKVANVDRKQIYATGMSNGAIMSYRLACELSDVVAAIGPVAATQNVDNCQPERPVPVIHFHGTDDQHAPYKGGIGAESLANVEFTSVTETIQFWTNHNGCTTSPKREQSGTIIYTTYSACDQDADVTLYTVVGGLHAWPGGKPGWRGADEPTQAISANELMWVFFELHPKP